MNIFKFLLLLGVGCLAVGAWARSSADAGASSDVKADVKAEVNPTLRQSEQRRAELRAALKASQGQALAGAGAAQELLELGEAPTQQERAQRRQQLRQQLREIRYESP